jgi:KipI family sensor histidine kinase inhibitor
VSEFPRILPFGDRALVVEFEDVLSPEVNARVRALALRLDALPGVVETVPTFRSLLVVIDPAVSSQAIADDALRLAGTTTATAAGATRTVEVPVVYGGEYGPDLPDVAAATGLTAEEVVRIHSGREYLVYMLGFAPGFPYIGPLDQRLRVPRLDSPRVRVPAGSVAVADVLTAIYPLQTPGGWRLIGRTPLRTYDPTDADPFFFHPGDRVRFVPVEDAAFSVGALDHPRPIHAGRHPVFEVLEPGLYSTLQDAGRPGFRSRGLPASGAMDPLALQIANAVVGNPQGAAALEVTAPGPVLRALETATVAVAGADLSATIDGTAIEPAVPVAIRPGQTMRFGFPRRGVWAYVAVAGGIRVPMVLGSASTYVPGGIGGMGGRRLIAGDILGRGEGETGSAALTTPSLVLPVKEVTIRCVLGPQADWFTADAGETLRTAAYRVTVRSDRAGIRLEGPGLQHRGRADILSDGMLPGAIQVPGGGQPIVIMPDGPTTGGYPKIGVVVSADLRLLAQAQPGTRIRFVETTVEEAHSHDDAAR